MKGDKSQSSEGPTTGRAVESLHGVSRKNPRPFSKAAKAMGLSQAPDPADWVDLHEPYKSLVELMVYGFDEGGHVEGKEFYPGEPLTLSEAAKSVGVRLRRARQVAACKAFRTEFSRELAAMRSAEAPRNLRTAVAIRDDEGDGSAATKTVRLKAIASIEGKAEGGSTVNVQINNQQVNQVSPGYVIRLDDPAPVIDQAAVIIDQASE
jgi:hypothetical protein